MREEIVNSAKAPAPAWAIGSAGALALLAIFAWQPQSRPAGLLRDFNAFYCAGHAISQRADPYRAEPLGACERTDRKPLASSLPGLSTPAPLPPYALAPFVLLAQLPYLAAATIWSLLLFAATGVAVVALHRMTGVAFSACVAAMVLGDGYASLCLGQLAPMAVAALAIAALFAQQRRYGAAGIAAVAAMLEPHVGLPACIVLFAWRPPARIPLACGLFALAAVSLAAGGMAANVEYVRSVIPAHALSEIVNEKQLSLTYLLHRAGASDAAALRTGDLWYVAMIVAALWAAPRVARHLQSDAAIVALPSALAVTGGPFVHIVQMPAALPLAFLLYSRAPATRRLMVLAIVALAIPWMQFVTLGSVFPLLAAVAAGVLVANLAAAPPFTATLAAILALCTSAASTLLVRDRVPPAEGLLLAHYDQSALAEASWSAYVHAVATWNLPAYDVARLPTLLGIALLAATACALALRRSDVAELASGERARKGIRPLHESV